MEFEKQRHNRKIGIIEVGGNWFEVSSINKVSKPTVNAFQDGSRCWLFSIIFTDAAQLEVYSGDPIDCLNSYDFVIESWVGVRPSKLLDMQKVLGPNFFKGTDYDNGIDKPKQ